MNWLDKLVIGVILVILALLAAEATKADGANWRTFTLPNNFGALSISEQPCTVPQVMEAFETIRVRVKAGYGVDIGEVKQSRLLWQGQVYAGCWVIDPGNGQVYNIDSHLDLLRPTIPLDQFVPHDEALPLPGNKGVGV